MKSDTAGLTLAPPAGGPIRDAVVTRSRFDHRPVGENGRLSASEVESDGPVAINTELGLHLREPVTSDLKA